jgi:predicted RNase H-like nuclease (RuvC/YqgF family)
MKRQRFCDLPCAKRTKLERSLKRKCSDPQSSSKRQAIKEWSTEEIFAKTKRIEELESQLDDLLQICIELKKENNRLSYMMSMRSVTTTIGQPYQTAY